MHTQSRNQLPCPTLLACLRATIFGLMLFSVSALRADDRTDITQLYTKLQAAQKAQSVEDTYRLLAPDFHHTLRSGQELNAKQFVELIGNQKSTGKVIKSMVIKVIKIDLHGDKAKVTNSFDWSLEYSDPPLSPGKPGLKHKLTSTGTVSNDLRKTTQGWRFVTLQTVSGKMTLDGKKLN
jgi:hypothetical protein